MCRTAASAIGDLLLRASLTKRRRNCSSNARASTAPAVERFRSAGHIRLHSVAEAREDSVPVAERGRPIPPGTAGSGNPQHGLDKQPVVLAAAAGIARLAETRRLHLRPWGVSQNESVHAQLESQPSPDENREGSVRSRAHRRRGRDREHDLIAAGLNEAAGCFGAMGKVTAACWRGCSDDGRAVDARRRFGEEDLADWVLNASNRSGSVVGQLWSRYCGSGSA